MSGAQRSSPGLGASAKGTHRSGPSARWRGQRPQHCWKEGVAAGGSQCTEDRCAVPTKASVGAPLEQPLGQCPQAGDHPGASLSAASAARRPSCARCSCQLLPRAHRSIRKVAAHPARSISRSVLPHGLSKAQTLIQTQSLLHHRLWAHWCCPLPRQRGGRSVGCPGHHPTRGRQARLPQSLPHSS